MAILVINTVKDLRTLRHSFTLKNETVGFVPTMGYLHAGHMTLIRQSLLKNDHTFVSIFVNPSQFAPTEDLDTYPRDLDHDLKVIENYVEENFKGSESEILNQITIFKPDVNEMYPSGYTMDIKNQKGVFIEVLGVSEQLEGKTRPTFFRGVATVVTKLLNAVTPTNAYFGQKDIQQTIVVKTMVRDLLMDVNIEIVPIVRNPSGLALSSRNAYLSEEIKEQVVCISQSLKLANESYINGTSNVEALTKIVNDKIILTNSKFNVDYISFNDPTNLDYLTTVDTTKGAILSLAVYVPNSTDPSESKTTRLIDNLILLPIN